MEKKETFSTDSIRAVPSRPKIEGDLGERGNWGEFPKTIDDSDIAYIATRLAIADALWRKKSNDCFDKWFEIESENENLKKEFEDLNERLHVKTNFKNLFISKEIFGYGLLSLGFEESASKIILEKEPENIKDISYIFPISKINIVKMETDDDPTSETYGDVLQYQIERPKGEVTEKVWVNAKRFLHWERMNIYNSREGVSMFKSMYNILLGYQNISYAIPEGVWQNVSPIRQLEMPDYFFDYTPAEQSEIWDDVLKYFKDPSVKSLWPTFPGWKFHVYPTNQGMDLEHPVDFIQSQISASSGISRYLLEGFPAGKLTGSEINRDEYYLTIENLQNSDIEPILREFYSLMQEHGILPDGDYKLIWHSLQVMSEEDKEKLKQMVINNKFKEALTAKAWVEAGFTVSFKDGEMIITDSEGNLKESESETATLTTGTDRMAKQEYEKLKELFGIDKAPLERRMLNKLLPHYIAWEETWRKKLHDLFWNQINKPGPGMGTDTAADVQTTLIRFEVNSPAFKKELAKQFKESYKEGGQLNNDVLSNIGFIVQTTFEPADVQSQQWLKAQSDLRYLNTTRDMNKLIKEGLNIVLEKGLRVMTPQEMDRLYKNLDASVVKAFDKYEGNLRAMVRTETARIVIASRTESCKQHGVKEMTPLVSSDACQICQDLVGVRRKVDDPQLIPAHPNCQCDEIPIILGVND